MMRKLYPWPCCLAALLFAAVAVADDAAAPTPRTTLTVAAYNIENLFDVYDDPYTQDETTAVKPHDQLEKIAAVLRKLDADVVALSEVENEGVLKEFIIKMLGDMGYRYIAAAASNDGRGIRTAILSRLPIRSITSYRHLDLKLEGDERTWRFARDLMHVQLAVSEKRTAHAFIVHLKSMRDDGNDRKSASWRLAETTMAKRLIDQVQTADPGAWVMMLGDFNSEPGTPPMASLIAAPQSNGAAADDNRAAAGKPLVDLHAHLPADAATYLKEPHRSRIDYILASEPMARRAVKDSAKIIADEKLLDASDHAPVVVTFDLKE